MNKNMTLEHLQKELSDVKGQINAIHNKRREFMRSYNEKLSKANRDPVKVRELGDSLVRFDTLANSKINKLRSELFVLNSKIKKTRSVLHATRYYNSSNNVKVNGVTRSKSSANINIQPGDSHDSNWKYKKALKAAKDEVDVFFIDLENADRLWRSKKVDAAFKNETDVRKGQNVIVNHIKSGAKQNSDDLFWKTLKKNEERWNSEKIYKRIQEEEKERMRYDKSHGTSIYELDNKLAELELSRINIDKEIRNIRNKAKRSDTRTGNFEVYSSYGQQMNPYALDRNDNREYVNRPNERSYSNSGGIHSNNALTNTSAKPKEYHNPTIGGVSASSNIHRTVESTYANDKKIYTNDGITPGGTNKNEKQYVNITGESYGNKSIEAAPLDEHDSIDKPVRELEDANEDIDNKEFEKMFEKELREIDNETSTNGKVIQVNDQVSSVGSNKYDVDEIDDAELDGAISEIDKESDYSDIGFSDPELEEMFEKELRKLDTDDESYNSKDGEAAPVYAQDNIDELPEKPNNTHINKPSNEKIYTNDRFFTPGGKNENDKEFDYSDIGFSEKRVNFVLSCDKEEKKRAKDTSDSLQKLSECLNRCSELGMKSDVINGICNKLCNDLKKHKIKCEVDSKGNYVVQGCPGTFFGIGGNLKKIINIVGIHTDKVCELIKSFMEKAKSNKWHQSMNKAQERSYQQNRYEVKTRGENIKLL